MPEHHKPEITVSAVQLDSIAVSGQTTSFSINDEFSFGGTVTATYNDGTTADVTADATFSGYDMSTAGTQTITVSYTDNITETTEYNITVTDSSGDPVWEIVSSFDIGDYVVFVNKADNKELSGISSSIGVATDFATTIDGSYYLTVEAGNGGTGYSFKTTDGTYLSWDSGNSLTTSSTKDNSSSWTLNSTSNGTNNEFKFDNVGTTSRILQYNTSNPRWACYTSSQAAFHIYKCTSGTPSSGGGGGGDTPSSTEVTITNTCLTGWSTTKGSQTDTYQNVTVSTDDGALNGTTQIRIYIGATLTLSAPTGKKITSIVITFTSAEYANLSGTGYTISSTTGTWSGTAANSVSLTNGNTQSRIQSIVVTYS